MLALSGLASPRKLALLAIAVFVVVILYLQSSPYGARLPTVPRPGTVSSGEDKSWEEKDHSKPEGLGHSVPPGFDDGSSIDHTPQRPGQEHVQPVEGSPSTTKSTSPDDTAIHRPGPRTSTQRHSPSPTVSSLGTTSTTSAETRTTVNHSFSTLSRKSYAEIHSSVQSLLAQWTPPARPKHWPPYEWYGTQRDYDPNRWEGLDWENDYYIANGIKKLKEQHPTEATPTPYLPYPDYNSDAWRKEWKGDYVPCKGARGKPLNESPDDLVKAYPVTPDGFPGVAVGDANVTGVDIDRCFDRYHRFGPYGFAKDETEQVSDWQPPSTNPDWDLVNWGELQDHCILANAERYNPNARQPTVMQPSNELPEDHEELPKEEESNLSGARYHPRTALLIRTWEGYVYTSNDIEAIRALVTELSLLSGGEYQVFLLVNIKDTRADIYNNDKVYKDLLEEHIPRELRSISVLWNENMLEEWYPKVGDWQVYWQQFMPVQWFSKRYPEFDYIWNWETDARYTGNHYHLLEKLREFSRKQPRKFLWERNARFYFPAAHGSYDAWLDDTHAAVQTAVKNGSMEPVWGPLPYNATVQKPVGPKPPHAMDTDDFEWGVGEEADLITLQPIWEPTHSEWTMRDKIWNYLPGIRPHFTEKSPIDEGFTHPDFINIPRRAYINTLSRFSRRQLHAMHMENRAGRTMQAEMWPATVALQHGLKAVYAPHPIWTDHRWPAWYMDAVFNADGREAARWSARGDSVYNQDREHNFAGWSWYYASDFPRILYRRWLGWPANIGREEQYPNQPLLKIGGEDFELEGVKVQLPGQTADGSQAAPAGGTFGGREMIVGGHGRMCLPPMLLHPIKKVYRGAEEDALRGSL